MTAEQLCSRERQENRGRSGWLSGRPGHWRVVRLQQQRVTQNQLAQARKQNRTSSPIVGCPVAGRASEEQERFSRAYVHADQGHVTTNVPSVPPPHYIGGN